MGMSASQARLIALTARMNDIEYQGQQINQQRTTLSSQVNALYNNLLAMDVPTPPSTIDYQKVVYSGTTGATKFTMSNVVPTGKNSAGNSTYSVDLAYQMTGHSVSKGSTSVNLSPATEFLYFNEVTDKSVYMLPSNYTRYEMDETPLTELPTDGETNVMVKMTVAQYNALTDKTGLGDLYAGDPKSLEENPAISEMDDSDIIYLNCNAGAIRANAELAALCGLTIGEDAEGNPTISGELENVYSGNLNKKTIQEYDTRFKNDQQIIANNLYVIENGTAIQITTQEDLKKYIEQSKKICQMTDETNWLHDEDLKIDNPTYNQDAQGTGLTVGNMAVYKLDNQAFIAKVGETSYKDYMEALRNSFPEFESLSDSDLAAKFFVYVETKSSGQQIPHFIKRDDIGAITKDYQSAQTYDYDADGTYTKTKTEHECELEFDASTGRISRIGIPDGNGQVVWVKLEAKTVTDEEAYNKAFNDYEYQKIKYDKEQQEINMQTSIIQAEDKSLELKLTRLDNERNAVNTEIEAVKKVVDDNIQKSFKTFSG